MRTFDCLNASASVQSTLLPALPGIRNCQERNITMWLLQTRNDC